MENEHTTWLISSKKNYKEKKRKDYYNTIYKCPFCGSFYVGIKTHLQKNHEEELRAVFSEIMKLAEKEEQKAIMEIYLEV